MSETKDAGGKADMGKPDPKSKTKHTYKRNRTLGAILNFYLWLPTPLKWIVLILGLVYSPPMVQNLMSCLSASKRQRLRVISGPDFIFFYPIGIWGLIFCWIAPLLPDAGQVVLSWLYLSLAMLTFITVGLDFRGASWVAIAIILFGGFAVLGWVGSSNDIPLLQMIWPAFDWFGLHEFPVNLVFAMSCSTLLVFLVVWIRMNIVNVLKIEGNYVQVWTLAARSPKDTRASFSIVPDYDDINEALMGFSCRLNLKSKSSRIQSHEFANMPGGPVVENIATNLLNAQEVTFANEDDLFHADEGEDDDE